ncbi:MAG TPA: outer membrane beta-barrel protein, partial [Vicinamibacteria bacterium]|nr:outer membrane beta-barrel protein [Vicinamibacteria bacterium]
IDIELDVEASSVVGLENASHLFVRIHRELPPGVQVAEAEPPVPVDDAPGVQEPPSNPAVEATETADMLTTTEASEDAASGELFFSLFPAPARKPQTLFNVAADEPLYSDEAPVGIRVGRFAMQPSVDASWIRGDNLLQSSEAPFVDTAYMVRGRVTATLLESVHDLKLVYEARYRDFQEFELEDQLTHLVDVGSELELTPTTRARISNHFVRGAFEAHEFDPGGEVAVSTDPFYRNYASGVVAFDLSERLGAEVNASYNVVDFLEGSNEFFDYDTRSFGGTFVYELSPLTSLLGEYVRTVTPEPLERPQAGSVADAFLVGLRGELTPVLRGEVHAGYADQRFDHVDAPQDFSGFVADASLTRDFGDAAALTLRAGRRTSPSAFDENGYYVSNYARLQLISPFARNLRLTTTAAFFLNDYPIPDASAILRNDNIFSGSAGLAYFFTPLTFLSVDYRHDRRDSNIELFSYNSNAIQLMVGFGFVNR